MGTSLALAREAKKRKRENIKNKLERMQSAKKQKLESAFETVQSNDNPNIRRIADLALIIKGLQQGCNQCSNTPLLLTDYALINRECGPYAKIFVVTSCRTDRTK